MMHSKWLDRGGMFDRCMLQLGTHSARNRSQEHLASGTLMTVNNRLSKIQDS